MSQNQKLPQNSDLGEKRLPFFLMNDRCKNILAAITALFVAAILLPTVSEATSVVIITAPNRIVIAADSKRTWFDGHRTTSYQHCKIQLVGNDAFALAGLVGTPEGFDPSTIVRQALSKSGSFNDRAATIAEQMRDPLLQALKDKHQQVSAERYAKLVKHGALDVGFAGIQDGVPSSVVVKFAPKPDKKGNPIKVEATFWHCPGDCAGKWDYTAFGYTDAFLKKFRKLRTGNLLVDAQQIIELEIQEAPDEVGPPIAILEIDTNGTHWLQACQ